MTPSGEVMKRAIVITVVLALLVGGGVGTWSLIRPPEPLIRHSFASMPVRSEWAKYLPVQPRYAMESDGELVPALAQITFQADFEPGAWPFEFDLLIVFDGVPLGSTMKELAALKDRAQTEALAPPLVNYFITPALADVLDHHPKKASRWLAHVPYVLPPRDKLQVMTPEQYDAINGSYRMGPLFLVQPKLCARIFRR